MSTSRAFNRFQIIVLPLLVLAILISIARSNEAQAQTPTKDCSRTSVGFTPLMDMSTSEAYLGQEGGLYGNGLNQLPADHPHWLKAQEVSQLIVPRDEYGNPTEGGKIGLISLGMSNTAMEFGNFINLADDPDSGKSSSVVTINGARPGATASIWVNPSGDDPWVYFADQIGAAGLTSPQVQVVWMKLTNGMPRPGVDDFPVFAQKLRDDLAMIVKRLKRDYPNVRIVYLSSRIYAGYSLSSLNPEPFAYETAFSIRWLIQDQMNGGGTTGVNYDNAPVLLWGPYLWADGIIPRSDGLTYLCDDLQDDGVHPASGARIKVAALLLNFFRTDPLASIWFTGVGGPPSQVADPVITPPGGSFIDTIVVSLSTATPGAQIFYTLDGTDPTSESTLYLTPFTLSTLGTVYVKARAFKEGMNSSGIVSATFYISRSGSQDGTGDFVSRWKFDEGSGVVALDDSLNQNTLSLINGAGWSEGRWVSALSLDGRDDFASRADAELNGAFPARSGNPAQHFTITAWVNLDRLGRRQPIATKQGFKARGFSFSIDASNRLNLEVFSAAFTSTNASSNTPLTSGTWQHVAVTYDYVSNGSSQIRFYLNGLPDGGVDNAVGPVLSNTQNLDVGRYGWLGYYFDGRIDDLRFYDRVLAPGEIAVLSGLTNEAPVAFNQTTTTEEDTPVDIQLTGMDPEQWPLTFYIVQQPEHGRLEGPLPSVIYTPATNYFGADSFTFIVNDGIQDSNPATVSLEVTPVNDAPVADFIATPEQGEVPLRVIFDASDSVDAEDDQLIYEWDFGDGSTGSGMIVEHEFTNVGVFHVVLTLRDTQGASAVKSTHILVLPPNHPPIAQDQDINLNEDQSVTFVLIASDEDGDPLTFRIIESPDHGELTVIGSVATYIPVANYFGPDSFTFIANDGTADSNPATVNLTTNPVNDPPIASFTFSPQTGSPPLTVEFDASQSIDIDSGFLTYEWDFGDGSSGNGVVTAHTYDQAGTFTILLTVRDEIDASGTMTASITIIPPMTGLIAYLEVR